MSCIRLFKRSTVDKNPMAHTSQYSLILFIQDDFEDLWPKRERPEAFLDAFLQWRPERIFPYEDPHDSNDDLLLPSDLEDEPVTNNNGKPVPITRDVVVYNTPIFLQW